MQTLAEATAAINKAYGKEAGGKGYKYPSFARLPTGILPLDVSIGGGLPMGSVSIFYGNESSGKTSLALRCVAQFQRLFGKGKDARKAIWIDVENAWDDEWVKLHGVDPDQVYLFKPTTAEEAADMMDEVAMAKDAGLIVVDSIAAMSSIEQLEKSAEQAIVAGATKPSLSMMRKLQAGISSHARAGRLLTGIYINQPRMKIGFVMGNPEILPGPAYQNFQAFLKLRLTGKDVLKEKIAAVPIYKDCSARVAKKKFPCIRQSCEWQMMLYPWEKGGKKLKPLDLNNHTHAEKLLEELEFLVHEGKDWILNLTGEVFGTKTAAIEAALADYDNLVESLVGELLLLYKDDIQEQLAEAASAGHK